MPKKTWGEKLRGDTKDLPKVVRLNANGAMHLKGETMAIPSPIEVNDLMRKVPVGKLTTMNEIREAVAKKHDADIGCPLTCGIFAWISAFAAEEEREQGKRDVTPYWRTLKTGGLLNEKYPGGVDMQKALLTDEGHKVIQKGKKFAVEGYETKLAKLV